MNCGIPRISIAASFNTIAALRRNSLVGIFEQTCAATSP
jgi:hypothetical protein